MNVRQAAFVMDEPRITVSDMKGRLVYDPVTQTLKAKTFTVRTPNSQLTLSASLNLNHPIPQISADLNLSPLSLADIAKAVGTPQLNRGDIQGKITVSGNLEAL